MKIQNYKPLVLAAFLAMLGLMACEKEYQEIGIEQEAKLQEGLLYKAQPANGSPVTYSFWAGRHINVGNLLVSNDEQNLYITFKTTGNWWLQLTHLHIATTLGGVPNRNGIPVPGHFQYKTSHNPRLQTFTYTIPKTWAEGQNLVIAAHAEVVLLDANGKVIQSETAFGGDTQGPGKRWWFWAGYTVGSGSGGSNPGNDPGNNPGPGPGPDPDPNPGDGFVFTYCTNAWAIDSIGESYLNGVVVDGVFFRIVDATGSFSYPLIASDNQGKPVIVGQIAINNSKLLSESYIEFSLNNKYALTNVSLYVKNSAPATVNLNDFNELTITSPQRTFRIYLNHQIFNSVDFDSGIYFVAANVKFCPSANQKLASR